MQYKFQETQTENIFTHEKIAERMYTFTNAELGSIKEFLEPFFIIIKQQLLRC